MIYPYSNTILYGDNYKEALKNYLKNNYTYDINKIILSEQIKYITNQSHNQLYNKEYILANIENMYNYGINNNRISIRTKFINTNNQIDKYILPHIMPNIIYTV